MYSAKYTVYSAQHKVHSIQGTVYSVLTYGAKPEVEAAIGRGCPMFRSSDRNPPDGGQHAGDVPAGLGHRLAHGGGQVLAHGIS